MNPESTLAKPPFCPVKRDHLCANLGVVATTLYEEFETYGRYPQRDTVTLHQLGPNGTYGWVAKLSYFHSGTAYRWVRVYGVIGHSVTLLTAVIRYFERGAASGCGTECSKLSAKYAFETHSSASLFYPIILRVSGIKNGRPFRGNYRLVFDKNSLTYLAPKNLPDEIKPERWQERSPIDRGAVTVCARILGRNSRF